MSPATTKAAVRAFTLSVALNAALGIAIFLGGDFGDREGRVLLTSFLVSAAMLSVLVNAPALRRRALWPAPVFGACGGVAGFTLLIVIVWMGEPGDGIVKVAVSGLIVGGAATLAAALTLGGELPTARWLQPATAAAIAALAITSTVVLWREGGGDGAARLIGIESTLVAAGTLLIPVLARFGGGSAPPAAVTVTCPHCGETFEIGD